MLESRIGQAQEEPAPERDFDRRGLITFFVVAYGLSWLWTIPLAVGGAVVEQGEGWPTHFPALAGPLLAAWAVTYWRNGASGIGDLLRGMGRWRVDWRCWLTALSPAIYLGLSLIVVVAGGDDLPAFADFGRFSGLPAIGVLGVFALIAVVNGYGEETGWRGYALPELQRRFRPLTATLILAAFWAAWHLPFFFTLASYQDFGPGQLVGFVLGLTAGAVVLTWLYNRSGGSILVPVAWHAIYNLSAGTAAGAGTVAAVVSTLVMVQGATLVWMEVRARRTGRPSVIGPR